MKTNLYKYDYNKKKKYPFDSTNKSEWFGHTEVCDKCGKIIFEDIIQSKKPDMQELDFCCECLRKFLDKNISYSEAKLLYGRRRL